MGKTTKHVVVAHIASLLSGPGTTWTTLSIAHCPSTGWRLQAGDLYTRCSDSLLVEEYHDRQAGPPSGILGPRADYELGTPQSHSYSTIYWLPLLHQLGDYPPNYKIDFCKQCSECMHMLQCLWTILLTKIWHIVMFTAASLVYNAWSQN